jgi:hypothetical protein
VVAEPEGGEQLIKLIPQPIDGALTGPQQAQLGFRSNAETQQLVRALDDLKWLPEIVSRYRKQHRLEIRRPFRRRLSRHAPSDGPLC